MRGIIVRITCDITSDYVKNVSQIQILKNKGAKVEPCGVPYKISEQLLKALLILFFVVY